MNVVHVVQFFEAGYAGGIQRYVAELARQQSAARLDVSVLTLGLSKRLQRADAGGERALPDVPVRHRPALGVWQRTPVHPAFLLDVRRLQADIVHLHSPSPALEASLLAARPSGTRLVVTLHNELPRTTVLQRALGRVETRLLGATLRRADAVIAPHEAFLRAALPNARQRLDGRLHFVPPGVDHCRFRDLQQPRDESLVVFAGHLRPEKGLHVLVEAMRRLPRLRVEVMAAVSYEDAYYRDVRRTAESQLPGRVEFHLNPSQAELEAAYNRAGCVVAPSLGLESWNLVLLEAAATGAACVRSDLPGLAWADFAEVAPAGNAPALAASIEAAIERREELGCRARLSADEYSWRRTHCQTLAVYRAVQG